MKAWLRTLLLLGGSSLLLGGDCMFGRPIVDEKNRYFPSDELISCQGTRCSSLPAFALMLPAPADDSPCARDLPVADLTHAGSSLTRKRYVVSSETPLVVTLGTVVAKDACIALSGPVQLTFGPQSQLSHVTILLGPHARTDPGVMQSDAAPQVASNVTPSVYLGYARLERVAMEPSGLVEDSGEVRIEFSSCMQCQTYVDTLSVTESNLQGSRLAADTLNLTGGTLDTVELSFEHGVLAGVTAQDVRTARCNTLSLVASTIDGRASQFGPCDCGQVGPQLTAHSGSQSSVEQGDAGMPDLTPRDAGPVATGCNGLSVFESIFLAGMLDGKIHAQNSTFHSVLFARHAPTALDLWNGNILLGVVCSHPMQLRLDGNSGVGCTSCDHRTTTTACRLGDDAPTSQANACPALPDDFPACKPPLPDEVTPPVGAP